MSTVFFNVLPIFVLILTGWLLVRFRYLKPGVGDALAEFVFRVAVPVTLFRTIAGADMREGSPWTLWVAYFSGVAVAWTLAHLAATRLFGRDARIGVLAGVSAGFANTVFIGLPLVTMITGPDGIVAISILLSVHLPVMMIAGTLMMEGAERRIGERPPRPALALMRDVFLNLIRNPLVIGLALGALWRLTGMTVPGPAMAVIDQLAATAAPAALVSIGMALQKYGISGNLGLAATTSTLKLVVMPAVVYGLCLLLGLNQTWTTALVLTASVPTGVNAWLIANHFNTGQALASSTITLTTAIGVVSVSAWAFLLI
ncbi:AEC family transporter [Ensifer soli]|uniref:AEC family transporter n=1 Tax=Ciceribacter sp. sgz301302 TaxID=3342379 RepID=UPI0035B7BAA8